MLMNDILPISQRLAQLANPALSTAEHNDLLKIINCLFMDLDAGDSCSNLVNIAKNLKLESSQVVAILLKSNLATSYAQIPAVILSTPFSLITTASETLIYISKYFYYELSIMQQVKKLLIDDPLPDIAKATQIEPFLSMLGKLSQEKKWPNAEQFAAIQKSIGQRFSIITGGPGTGKTTTVTMLLWLMYQVYGTELKVKICAPTGKAALRVKDSLENNIRRLRGNDEFSASCSVFDELLAQSGSFVTIHKLLGYQSNNIYFKHNQNNLLDVEVLIVDESSMVGLPLFSKLLAALNPTLLKHVIFLGDKNQLSSVEEGYVFASLVNMQRANNVTSGDYDLFSLPSYERIASELIISNRNEVEIAKFAAAILQQNCQSVRNLLNSSAQIKLYEPALNVILHRLLLSGKNTLISYMEYLRNTPTNEINYSELFENFSGQSVLCLTNSGVLGSENLNLQIERKLRQHYAIAEVWYSGRPVIILQNDYSLELFNGDVGICVVRDNKTMIVFNNGREFREFIPEVLPKHRLAYAITIHKSQGSEYSQVNIVLPKLNSESAGHGLLSRELIYTAVTRAKEGVTLFSDESTIISAIERHTSRNSGLPYLLHKSSE